MGTASSGGSGSGSGTRAGGGGDSGGYISSGRNMENRPYDEESIRDEITALFKELFSRASSYMEQMFSNPYLDKVYSELFKLSSLVQNLDPEEAIADRYKLDMNEPGFILNLISQLHENFRDKETDARCMEAVRNALEKFLFKAVKDDPYLSIDGNGKEVLAEMKNNAAFWKSISGYFLLYLSVTVYKKDIEAKVPQATYAAAKEIERRTNHVLASYKEVAHGQTPNYKAFFNYISQNWDWFKKEMTK